MTAFIEANAGLSQPAFCQAKSLPAAKLNKSDLGFSVSFPNFFLT
jgi:hypothetical protein